MLKSDAKAHFQTYKAIAQVLGLTKSAVSMWGEIVPEGPAYKLESITRRKLRVNPALYAHKHAHTTVAH